MVYFRLYPGIVQNIPGYTSVGGNLGGYTYNTPIFSLPLTLYPPAPIVFGFFYRHITYQLLNMLKLKCDVNEQDF